MSKLPHSGPTTSRGCGPSFLRRTGQLRCLRLTDRPVNAAASAGTADRADLRTHAGAGLASSRCPPGGSSRPPPRGRPQRGAAHRRRWARSRSGALVAVQDRGQRLDPVDQARARTGEGGVGIHRPDRYRRPAAPRPRSSSCASRTESARPKPHGAETTTSGEAAATAAQVVGTDRSPARPSTHVPPACSPSRAPSGRGRRAGRSTPAPPFVAAPGRHPRRPRRPGAPAARRPGPGLGLVAGRRADLQDGGQHLLQVVRVGGEHLGATAEVLQGCGRPRRRRPRTPHTGPGSPRGRRPGPRARPRSRW